MSMIGGKKIIYQVKISFFKIFNMIIYILIIFYITKKKKNLKSIKNLVFQMVKYMNI